METKLTEGNSSLIDLFKDENMRFQISNMFTQINSISIQNGQILIEKQSYTEGFDIPEFISKRMVEALSFYAPNGATSLNSLLDDSVASLLGNTQIMKIVNNNGSIQFFDANGKQIDANVAQSNVFVDDLQITKEDIDLLTKALVAEIDRNAQIQKLMKSTFGKNSQFRVTVSNANVIQESAIKRFARLQEGALTGIATGIKKAATAIKNDFNTTKDVMKSMQTNDNATQRVSFNLKVEVTNNDEIEQINLDAGFEDLKFLICKLFSGKNFKDKQGNQIKFTLFSNQDVAVNGSTGDITIEADMSKTPAKSTKPEQQTVSQQQTAEHPIQQQTNQASTQKSKPTRLDKKLQKAEIRNLNAQTKALKQRYKNMNGKNFWKDGFLPKALKTGSTN